MRRIGVLLMVVAVLALPALLSSSALGDADAPSSEPDVLEIADLAVLDSGLSAPGDVAIADDGTVYVLDGYKRQLSSYAEDDRPGESIAVPGDAVGVGWGAGRLWVPLTDRPVLASWDRASGTWHERPVDGAGEGAYLTDAVVVGDHVLVTAHDLGLWRAPLDGGPGEWFALPGEMPFLAAASGDEAIAVGDVQDDTVVVLEPGEEDWLQVAQWGVWEGSFLHPTGVAVDRRGRIFVADGFLGVVQAFNRDGELLGALGRDGELLRLEHPMGVAIVDDRLYVVDWLTGQLVVMEVDDRTRPRTRTGLYRRKVPRVSYLEEEASPKALLTPVCQSCHDGSVRSSAHVWDDELRQHPVDIASSKPIEPPFTVDEEGNLYCGSCHIPHLMNPADEMDPEHIEVFLKEPRARSRLCVACHRDVVAEVRDVSAPIPEAESGHLLGAVPRTTPRTGIEAIADGIERVECLDCHAAHGAVGDALINRESAASGGCTRCHIGVSEARGARTHPVERPLDDETAVGELALRDVFLGPGDTVTCLTCHDVHLSPNESWLTSRMEANERCIICHRAQASLQGGGHDIRRGQKGHVATACLSCHSLHGATGPALGRAGGDMRDPTGCLGCHRGGGSARTRIDPNSGHPLFEQNPGFERLPSVAAEGSLPQGTPGNMGCLTCHDPHATAGRGGNVKMLRLPGSDADTCLACHQDKAPVRGSDHDLRLNAVSMSGSVSAQVERAGFCVTCHGTHRRSGWQGWNGPLGGSSSDSMATRTCLGCHEVGAGRGATVIQVWDHPDDLLLTTASVPWHNTGELPLYDASGGPTDDSQIGRIACLTCHDPHIWSPKRGGAGGTGLGDIRTSFLREGWEGFCAGCHGEEALAVYKYYHDPNYRSTMRERSERRDWPIYEESP